MRLGLGRVVTDPKINDRRLSSLFFSVIENPIIYQSFQEGLEIQYQSWSGAIHLLRSHRGGRGLKEVANFANDSTDRLREMRTRGGRVPKVKKFCEHNKWMPPHDNFPLLTSFKFFEQ